MNVDIFAQYIFSRILRMVLSLYSTETSIRVGYPTQQKRDKQHEIYTGVCVGGNANVIFCVGGKANSNVFRYQHVGIANTKIRVGPNASSSASQWNIGLRCAKI